LANVWQLYKDFRMRIMLNTRFLLANGMEGIGWYKYELISRIVKAHPEHEFIFLFDRPFHEKFIFASNVIPLISPFPARHPILWYLWFEYWVKKQLAKYKPDVFYSPDGYLCLATEVPTVLTIHDLAYLHDPEHINFLVRKYYGWFMPKFAAKADRIITVSEFVKHDIAEQFHVNPDKIVCIHNGVRSEFKQGTAEEIYQVRSRYTGGKPYFLYYGAIQPRKNILRVITAFELFKQRNTSDMKFILAGRMAWQSKEVVLAIKNSPFSADFIHLDHLGDELPEVVRSAFALVYVSISEGFGLPIAEAMASGVPVITSNVSSMPEVAGDAALLVDPASVNEIEVAMTSLYINPNLKADLIRKGQLQSSKFSWDLASEELWAQLEAIIK